MPERWLGECPKMLCPLGLVRLSAGQHFTTLPSGPRESPLIPPAWEPLQLAASLIDPVFFVVEFFFFALLDAATYTCEHMEGIDGNWQT